VLVAHQPNGMTGVEKTTTATVSSTAPKAATLRWNESI
jgi:hypothetical protein